MNCCESKTRATAASNSSRSASCCGLRSIRGTFIDGFVSANSSPSCRGIEGLIHRFIGLMNQSTDESINKSKLYPPPAVVDRLLRGFEQADDSQAGLAVGDGRARVLYRIQELGAETGRD